MELYAKGQLSFLILTCLKERDFYGLDIISEIANRSNGRINLKKPSVYSNLTRMETQGYISSYLQSSDFGPNRKYYSLTESGRKFYQELKDYFDRNNVDPFKGLLEADSPSITQVEITNVNVVEDQPIQNLNNDHDDFFDFSSIEQSSEVNQENTRGTEEESAESKVTNDYRYITNEPAKNSIPSVSIVAEEKSEEVTETSEIPSGSPSIDEYNRRLYDISKDINKYKRKRSFAEDQIAMTATAPLNDSQEKTKASIEEFKSSFLENKNKYHNERIENLDFSRYTSTNKSTIKEAQKQEEVKNDAVFITQRYSSSDLEKPKKIEPPRLKIAQVEPVKETKLPAPKRDLTIDPSHKEILSKLYSKSKDSSTDEVREDALYDFNDLKKYYNKQNIAFTEYKKPADKVEHNTNKLYLWVSLISLALSAGLSTLLFVILYNTNLVNSQTNFLFILLPALLILDVIWKFYNYKKYKGWLPSQMMPQWQVWTIFLVTSAIIVALNFICGMSSANFAYYATTTILPLILAFALIPMRYYIKRILLVKYWK